MALETVRKAVIASGLSLRGGFHPDSGDGVPTLADGARPKTLLLLGNSDAAMWKAFRAAPEGREEGGSRPAASNAPLPNSAPSNAPASNAPASNADLGPLDRWSLRVIGELADRLEAEAVFPFGGPPYYPFQAWAQKAEPVWPSPLGVLVHREHGLWHAYRGALCFDREIDLPARDDHTSPCLTCAAQPCLTRCPVAAFSQRGYDVSACAGHLATPAGADCMELGCRARRACPLGVAARYEPAQAAFHMRAFLTARPK